MDMSPLGSSTDSPTDAGTQFTLTIHDYIGWCAITVNNGTPSTSDPQTYVFAPSTNVSLHGESAADASFYWGYWGNVGTDGGLADGGQDLNQNVSFAITGNTTLNACCPDNGFPLTQCTF